MLHCRFCGHESLFAVCRTTVQRGDNCPHYKKVYEGGVEMTKFKPAERYFVVELRGVDRFAIYDNVVKKFLELNGRAVYSSFEAAELELENYILNVAMESNHGPT